MRLTSQNKRGVTRRRKFSDSASLPACENVTSPFTGLIRPFSRWMTFRSPCFSTDSRNSKQITWKDESHLRVDCNYIKEAGRTIGWTRSMERKSFFRSQSDYTKFECGLEIWETRKKLVDHSDWIGAEGGTRTPTSFRSHDPESCASTRFRHFGNRLVGYAPIIADLGGKSRSFPVLR